MAVVDGGVDRIRRQGRGIVPLQLDQGARQVMPVALRRGKGIRLEFVAPREEIENPREPARDRRREHHEQQQDRHRHLGEGRRRQTEDGVKPGLAG